MITPEEKKALDKRLATWSDDKLSEARQFMRGFEHLVDPKGSKDVTNSQLHGLRTLVRHAATSQRIQEFILKQGLKAERKRHSGMHEFWNAIEKHRQEIDQDGRNLCSSVNSKWAHAEEILFRTRKQMFLKYLQHIIAEKLIITSEKKEQDKQQRNKRQKKHYNAKWHKN